MYKRFEPSEQVFVDREEHLEWMDGALKRCKNQAIVLQLSGIGGIGKSSLLDYWNRTIESTIRLDCRQYSDFYSRLNILAKGAVLLGIKLPRFDVLWQIRLRFVEGLEPVKEEGREWAKEILTAIPFIGSLANIGGAIGVISSKVAPKLKGRYGDLASWMHERLGGKHIEKLLEILWKNPSHAQYLFADALAEDVNSRKRIDEPILFMLDHYEHVDNESRNWRFGGKKITESELWCIFLSSLKNCVGVLATRQTFSSSPHEEINVEQIELTELDEKSCTELLDEQGVNEEKLQKRIVSVSGGNPFVIDAICDMLESGDVLLNDVDHLQAETLDEVRLKTWRRLFSHAEGLLELVNRAGLVPYFTKDIMAIILPSLTSDQWDRLCKLSFVREQSDGTYVLHELAKDLVVSELGNRLEEITNEVAGRLEMASEKESDLSLLGMAISVLSHFSVDDSMLKLQSSVDDLIEDGFVNEAFLLLSGTSFESDKGQAVARGLKGKVLVLADRYAEAEIELRVSIDYFQNLQDTKAGFDKDFMADCLTQLGSTLWQLFDQTNARQSFLEAISIRRELANSFGQQYLKGLAWSLVSLAWHTESTEPDEAEKLAIEAIDALNRIDDTKNKSRLLVLGPAYNALGVIQGNLFKWSEQEDAMRNGLEIQRELLGLGLDSPGILSRTSSLCNNLGIALSIHGRETEARELFEEASYYRKKAAETQPEAYRRPMVTHLQNLGFMYLKIRKPLVAEGYFREANDIMEEELQDVASDLGQLGYLLSGLAYVSLEKDELHKATGFSKRAVEIRRDLMESTPWGKGFGFALNTAGVVYSKLKKKSVAEESFKEAIKVLKETKMDPLHIPLILASCMNNYSVLLLQMGRLEEAIEEFGTAVQILRDYMKSAPELHPGWVAEILTNFAVVQKQNGNLDYSGELLEEALDFESKLVDIAPESYLYYKMHTLQVYSSLLRQKGDREEAKALLEESLSLAKKCSDLEMSMGEPGMGEGDDARFLLIY